MPFTYQSNMPWDILGFALSCRHGSHLFGSSSSGYQIHCMEFHRQNQKQRPLLSECQRLLYYNLPLKEKNNDRPKYLVSSNGRPSLSF